MSYPEPKIVHCEFSWILRDLKKNIHDMKTETKKRVQYLHQYAFLNSKCILFYILILG